jgi:hypothetical protein
MTHTLQNVEQCRNFLRDTIEILYERAKEAQSNSLVGEDADRLHAQTRLLVYYEVLSVIQNQAEAFGIPLHEIYPFEADNLLT